MFGTLAGIAGNILGSVFGGGEQAPKGGGYTSSGWPADNKGVMTSQSNEPVTEPEEPRTKWEKANDFLGSNVGQGFKDLAGGFIGDARQRRNSRKHMDMLESKGLTPWEAAGSGAGGGISAQGNTLGSGPTSGVQSQQAFQREQAHLERENRKEVAAISAEPSHQSNVISGQRLTMDMKRTQAEIENIKEQTRWKQFEREVFWDSKYASMGPDNMLAAVIAYRHGLDAETLLRSKKGQSAEQRNAYIALESDFKMQRSAFMKELLGVVEGVGSHKLRLQGAGQRFYDTLGEANRERSERYSRTRRN